MALYTIKLNGLQLHAPIGWYPEEQLLGNSFVLHIQVDIMLADGVNTLKSTLDYAGVYQMALRIFSTYRGSLLEELVNLIGKQLLESDQRIEKVSVELEKQNPLLGGPVKSVSVSRTFLLD